MKANHNEFLRCNALLFVVVNISSSKNESKSQRFGVNSIINPRCCCKYQ
ncbi:hypothetical protein GJJ64_03430 [Pedobacter sp. HX-22-1]|uniref:Uncharacterized protein n=1 Tax=Pedobacter puniceum TaxID=2666136 RepID=A0A7K0FKD1_9SPHI|nr:hypothetical protein [Pedobacter puniceum]MRX46232.1 hypothetical protein [Pedobacter puniceum]